MRKITEQAVNAFLAGRTFHQGNMVVQPETDGRVFMYLYGNRIACKYADGTIKGTLAGWPTPTTRERLNGIAAATNGRRFFQIDHCQLHEDESGRGWPVGDDEWVTIKPFWDN